MSNTPEHKSPYQNGPYCGLCGQSLPGHANDCAIDPRPESDFGMASNSGYRGDQWDGEKWVAT